MLIARAVFPEAVARLREHFEVEPNLDDTEWTTQELSRRLQGKAGLLATAGEPINAALLDANPQLRAVCLMTMGYNNIDVKACTARGVLATNAPGVPKHCASDASRRPASTCTRTSPTCTRRC